VNAYTPTPEQLAVRMVGRALDNATMPDPDHIVEATGLSRPEVDTLIGKMLRTRQHQAPRKPPAQTSSIPPTPDTAPPTGDDPGVLLAWAAQHPDPNIRGIAEKASQRIRAHLTRHARQVSAQKRRQRIAQLRDELDQLQGVTRRPCPDCGTPVRPDRLTQHRAKSAKHRETTQQAT
jgi:hypothetical protein